MVWGKDGILVLEMIKWFDINYYYLVLEIILDIIFKVDFFDFLEIVKCVKKIIGKSVVFIIISFIIFFCLSCLEFVEFDNIFV